MILGALGNSGYRDRGDRPVRNCVVRSGRGYALGIGPVVIRARPLKRRTSERAWKSSRM